MCSCKKFSEKNQIKLVSWPKEIFYLNLMIKFWSVSIFEKKIKILQKSLLSNVFQILEIEKKSCPKKANSEMKIF